MKNLMRICCMMLFRLHVDYRKKKEVFKLKNDWKTFYFNKMYFCVFLKDRFIIECYEKLKIDIKVEWNFIDFLI